ncbi:MAG: hypothetical protein R3C59_25440 [Planctomycetaceae bacterium]
MTNIRSQHSSFMPLLMAAACWIVACGSGHACNVPVFRYALERWQPDACDIIVFHDIALTDVQRDFIQTVRSGSASGGGTANAKVVVQQTDAAMDNATALLWDELRQRTDVRLPYVVVRSTIGNGRTINNWRGPLKDAAAAGLLSSPVRTRLAQRLVTGTSAVWIVLKSDNAKRNAEVLELLNTELENLSKKIPLPDGIGLPGSELFSEIPLLMKFSVLEVDANDPHERFLVSLLTGFEPDTFRKGIPLVVPVFGRGRALEVIPAERVDAGLIEDLTLFLCGACSCQVKEQNPGFDLLISTAWNRELFGDNADDVAAELKSSSKDVQLPELLVIPPGKNRSR